MIEASQLWGIAAASTILIVIPGPSVLFVVGRALSSGRRVAMISVAGNSLGSAVAAVTIAVGLGPVIERSDLVLATIRYAGALYLIWLGLRAWRRSDLLPTAETAPVQGSPLRHALLPGVLVGVSNPKSYILFAAILPQFVDRSSATPVVQQLLVLAAVPLVIGFVSDNTWALVAGTARAKLVTSPRRMKVAGRVGAASLTGLGVSVALEGLRRS